ncbi:MAG: hypothetical protein R2877_05140 [Bdellovibrionota bacterium]
MGNWEIKVFTENGKRNQQSDLVTSGGNAVLLKKINIGTPHEMISFDSSDGTSVAMTQLPHATEHTACMQLTKTEPGKMFSR